METSIVRVHASSNLPYQVPACISVVLVPQREESSLDVIVFHVYDRCIVMILLELLLDYWSIGEKIFRRHSTEALAILTVGVAAIEMAPSFMDPLVCQDDIGDLSLVSPNSFDYRKRYNNLVTVQRHETTTNACSRDGDIPHISLARTGCSWSTSTLCKRGIFRMIKWTYSIRHALHASWSGVHSSTPPYIHPWAVKN